MGALSQEPPSLLQGERQRELRGSRVSPNERKWSACFPATHQLIAIGATAIAIGGGAYGIVSATASNGSSTVTTAASASATSGATRPRQRGIQRSVWTGRRGIIRHGRQRVHVELHAVDISGSEGDRQQGVLHDIPEGDELELGECHQEGRKRPRTWDDQRNDHHGQQGHRATDCGGGSATSSAAGVVPFQRGAPSTSKQVGQIPANYSQGSGTIVSGTAANKATEAALAAYPGGVVDRVVKLSNGEYEVHNIGVNWPHHIFVNQDFKVVGAN